MPAQIIADEKLSLQFGSCKTETQGWAENLALKMLVFSFPLQ